VSARPARGDGLPRRVIALLLWIGCDPRPTPTLEDAARDLPPARSADDLEARRRAVVAELRAVVDALSAEGVYRCCIRVACSWCATHTGGCACHDGLLRGEPVCEECALMWDKGQGSVPGVDPCSVRSFLEASRAVTPCGSGG